MSRRRVVITGVGVMAPGGIGTKNFWQLISEGKTATRPISSFDASNFRSRIAAEIDFEPSEHGLSRREIRRMDRAAQLAVVATREAMADSGIELDKHDPYRVGVSVGTAVGATMSLEEEYQVVSDSGRLELVDHDYAVPHLYDYLVPSSFAAEVAWSVHAQGPTTVISTGCTSGLDSVGHAVDLLREGSADVMIAGACEAPLSPITLACFDAIKATTPRNDDPEHASRPFDNTRNGFVLGEGAAMFVLEELTSAQRRGAKIYAEVGGFGSRCNAFHMTGLRPDGAEMAAAIGVALDEAGTDASDIDYINAHGSGTKQNDRHETAAFKRSLGEHAYRTPVSSIKSMIGHSLGAIGSIEIAASVLAMDNNVVPPTANLHTADPECDLDYVPITARDWKTDSVLTVGSGFGGFQSAMVLTTPERGVG
ncbi:beta-ketoacyl-[acyl-carrier-protein] synthase family protein [Rhodococcus sp. BGS-1C]|uniref:beta-ketoacyl-[acyl-carrier-protein] synthase family protein n=1 Tax=unclassified Rhodococcus (in: high G+C Gram-positive bacteria) TaxID=192944 RepID=UPI000965EF4F|nr:beta-ketoacyl-[acyl-carrier-protein] synthase family protein [Rhodococcus sp. KRD197]OLT35802.1 beta-ACP synthase [Rhodococcus sp. CUA-806]